MSDGEEYRCRYIPFWFSFANFINAGIWIAYSVIYKIDVYVLVSAFIFFVKMIFLIDFPLVTFFFSFFLACVWDR